MEPGLLAVDAGHGGGGDAIGGEIVPQPPSKVLLLTPSGMRGT